MILFNIHTRHLARLFDQLSVHYANFNLFSFLRSRVAGHVSVGKKKRDSATGPFRRDVMDDDCRDMLTSTNYEPFESARTHFTSHRRAFSSGFVGLPSLLSGGSKLRTRARVRRKSARRRLFAELNASFRAHESTREIGSMAILIRGLK